MGLLYDVVLLRFLTRFLFLPACRKAPSGAMRSQNNSSSEFSTAAGISPSAMAYMLELDLKKKYGGQITADETGLPVTESGAVLPCGGSARWTAGK